MGCHKSSCPRVVAEITTVTKGKTRRKKMHISVSLFTKILFTYKNKRKYSCTVKVTVFLYSVWRLNTQSATVNLQTAYKKTEIITFQK